MFRMVEAEKRMLKQANQTWRQSIHCEGTNKKPKNSDQNRPYLHPTWQAWGQIIIASFVFKLLTDQSWQQGLSVYYI